MLYTFLHYDDRVFFCVIQDIIYLYFMAIIICDCKLIFMIVHNIMYIIYKLFIIISVCCNGEMMEFNCLNGSLADEQETIVSHVIINISPSKYNYITNHAGFI